MDPTATNHATSHCHPTAFEPRVAAPLRLVAAAPLRVVDVAMLPRARTGDLRTYLDAKARWAASAPHAAIDHHALHAPAAGHAVERAVAELEPDVVLLHDPFWHTRRVVDAARSAGACVVGVHHGTSAAGAAALRRPARAWLRRCYAHVDAVMAAVDPRIDCGRQADLRLRLGVDAAFRPRPGVPRGDETVYVGRLERGKGIQTLLSAAARAPEPYPLRIVGAGPLLRAIRARGRRLGLRDRLRLEPFIDDRAALARVYARARCVVLPGERETFGLVALEAACSGARIVTCATTPAARVVGDRVCDTFLPGDVDGLADAIAAARTAPADGRTAGELAARHGWAGVFAAELERLRVLAR